MRSMSLALTGLLLLGVALVYFLFFDLKRVHLSALVPDDYAFAVVYSSVDDLRASYEAPYARRDTDVGTDRIARPINVLGLEGVSQQQPVGSYWTADMKQVWIVPTIDFGALEEAFFTHRENTRLRPPARVARNYVSLSESSWKPSPGPDETWVRKATTYPIALVGKPRDGILLTRMLAYLFAHEPSRKPAGVRILGREILKMPRPVSQGIAAQMETLLVGFRLDKPELPVGIDVECELAGDSAFHHTLPDGLGNLVSAIPTTATAFGALALKEAGWKSLGLPLDVGDAALAVALIHTKHRARPNTVLLIARTEKEIDPAVFVGGASLDFETLEDRGTRVETADLGDAPAGMETILKAFARKPPSVYLSMAREKGVTYLAIGSQAHQVVRHALGCARGATELSLARLVREKQHEEVLAPESAGAFWFDATAAKGLGTTMPLFEIRSIAVPSAVSGSLRRDGDRLHGDVRIYR